MRHNRPIYALLTLVAGIVALGLIPAQAGRLHPERAPVAAASTDTDDSPRSFQRYRAEGVRTREQRSAIVATGAEIEAVGPDFLIVVATPAAMRGSSGHLPRCGD